MNKYSLLEPPSVLDHSYMAYDETLAGRIRDLVADEPGLDEKKMFGGIAFLIDGNMAVSASGEGGLLLRVDPADSPALVANTDAYVAEMRGRSMPGWLRVDGDHLRGSAELAGWVARGVSYARSLPAKYRQAPTDSSKGHFDDPQRLAPRPPNKVRAPDVTPAKHLSRTRPLRRPW